MAEEAVTPPSGEGLTAGGRKREEWSSRWAFYFAGVGAAVGFGKFDENATRSISCLLTNRVANLYCLAFFHQVMSGVSRVYR